MSWHGDGHLQGVAPGRNTSAEGTATWSGTYADLGVQAGSSIDSISFSLDRQVADFFTPDYAYWTVESSEGDLISTVTETGTEAWSTIDGSTLQLSGVDTSDTITITLTFDIRTANDKDAIIDIRWDNFALDVNYTPPTFMTDTDNLGLTLVESEHLEVSVTDSDTLTLGLTETDSPPTGSISDTDSLPISLSEDDNLLASTSDTDSINIALSEDQLIKQTDIDTLDFNVSESGSIVERYEKTDTDVLSLSITEIEIISTFARQAQLDEVGNFHATLFDEVDNNRLFITDDGTIETTDLNEVTLDSLVTKMRFTTDGAILITGEFKEV